MTSSGLQFEVAYWLALTLGGAAQLAAAHCANEQTLDPAVCSYNLAELCLPITASASRRGGLGFATTSNLVIPRCRLSTYGTCAFSVAGLVCWNSLPDYIKSSDFSFNCFGQQLKTFLFCKYRHQSQHYFSTLETLLMRSTNPASHAMAFTAQCLKTLSQYREWWCKLITNRQIDWLN